MKRYGSTDRAKIIIYKHVKGITGEPAEAELWTPRDQLAGNDKPYSYVSDGSSDEKRIASLGTSA